MNTPPLTPSANARTPFLGWSNEQLVLDLATLLAQGDADPAQLAAYEAEMDARALDGDPYWHYPTQEQARAWARSKQRANQPVYASVDGRFFTRQAAAHAYAQGGQLLRISIREYLPDARNGAVKGSK